MIKLTQMHYQFWMERQGVPPWAQPFAKKRAAVSVHTLINVQVGRIETDAHNILTLVSLRRRNGDSVLEQIAPSSWDLANFKKRYYQYARWRRRLVRSLRIEFTREASTI